MKKSSDKKDTLVHEDKKHHNFVYAYDPKIKRRVAHVIKDGYVHSLVTGHKFKYDATKHHRRG